MEPASHQEKQRRKINAAAFVADVKAHVPDSILATRHGLTSTQVISLKAQLVEKGLLDPALPALWTCPKCGMTEPQEPQECPRCGVILSQINITNPSPKLEIQSGTKRPQKRRAPITFKEAICEAASWLCVLLAIAGVGIAASFFFAFDTTVATSSGSRVHNIGLMAQQQSGILFGLGLAILCSIVAFFSKSYLNRSRSVVQEHEGRRPC